MKRRTSELVQTRAVLAGTDTRLITAEGRGPAVLLLHGYTDSADTWRTVMAQLAARGRSVVAVDLPHHGTAGQLPGEVSLAGFDAFVRAAVDHVDNGNGVVIVGNSLGALLALRAADSRVVGLRSALALAPPGTDINAGLHALPHVGTTLASALRIVPIPDAVLQNAVGWAYALATTAGRASADARRAYSSHLTRARLRDLILVGREVVPEVVQGPGIGELAIPVDVWWGTADIVCPIRGSGDFDGIGRKVVTPGAHCPQVASPDLVLALLDGLEAQTLQVDLVPT